MKFTQLQEKLVAVEVSWIDSASDAGWNRPNPKEDKPATIRSVGLLVGRDKERISLSTCCGPRGGFIDTITIPICAVRRVRRLTPKSLKRTKS